MTEAFLKAKVTHLIVMNEFYYAICILFLLLLVSQCCLEATNLIFPYNKVLLEIRNQLLCLWFPCMTFSLRNAFWDVSSFISDEENIQEFFVRRKHSEARRE